MDQQLWIQLCIFCAVNNKIVSGDIDGDTCNGYEAAHWETIRANNYRRLL